MTRSETHVIVGANLAGGRAAEGLRQAGFDGRVVLIGAEPFRPYMRPPLSKEFLLLGDDYAEEKLYLRPPEYYAEQRIELRLDMRATRLDMESRVVELASGEQVAFDRLLIATGASLRRIDVPGADLEGIYYLRTTGDAEQIRSELLPNRKVVIVGAGFIGAEIAAACLQRGLEVVMLEVLAAPLERALGKEIGDIFGSYYREGGVDLRTSEGIQAFRGSRRVESVLTGSGREVACDFAIVGVGVVPETGWLAGSGVALENGVLVDEFCETNIPGIFAAGDVANWWNPLFQERMRVEHDMNAQNQGSTAARNMLGMREAYAPVPFVWSDQGDLHLQMVGHATHWDEIVVRGDPNTRSFTAFYLAGGRVKSALGLNRPQDIMTARRLIQAQTVVRPENLADAQTNLKVLLRPTP